MLVYFLLLIFTNPLDPISFASTKTLHEQCEEKYYYLKPPVPFPKCSNSSTPNKILPFNAWLYSKLGVVAYIKPNIDGSPSMESLIENRIATGFKAGWQDEESKIHKGAPISSTAFHPTFNVSGIWGEYRYYGYDRQGELYTNPYFINDASVTDPDTRAWIYQPWRSSSRAQENKTAVSKVSPLIASKFGDSTDKVYDAGNQAILDTNNIIKSNFVSIQRSANGEDKLKRFNMFDYMYVEQDPTARSKGIGRMWHLTAKNEVWYQTFEIPKTVKTPPKAEATPTIIKAEVKLQKLSENFTYVLDLAATIKDEAMYDGNGDRYDRAKYYYREDVTETVLKLDVSYPGGTKTTVGTWSSKNPADQVLLENGKQTARKRLVSVQLKKTNLKKDDVIQFTLTSMTYYDSDDNPKPRSQDSTDLKITLDEDVPPIIIPEIKIPEDPLPNPLICPANIPLHAFDIVSFPASDGTDLSRVEERNVYVDGVKIDDDTFFEGKYVFGDDADGLHRVDIQWKPKAKVTDPLDPGCVSSNPVYVHDTVPTAQFKLGGTFKENRKITVDENAASANDPYVLAAYPITSFTWTWEALDTALLADQRIKINGASHKEFLFKKSGEYALTLKVRNSLGRESEMYRQQFWVQEDFAPAVIMTPYASEVARGESVPLFYDAVSTDSDTVTKQHFNVYYDAAGDETYTQLIDSFDGLVTAYTPTFGKLGKYRIVATVDEDFGQETFPEFLTPADKRRSTAKFEFWINNYIPYSDIYTDIPTVRPQIDVFFLLDKNLEQSKIDYVKGNGVVINNQLRAEGIDPDVDAWDMHTYTYSQASTTYKDFGTSSPPATLAYCAGGYCGTLSLYDKQDYGGSRDFGSDKTETQTKTATGSCSNTQSVTYNSSGVGTVSWSGSCPGSQSYSDGDGYSGTLSRLGTSPSSGCGSSGTPNGACSTTFSTSYSGTVSRTVVVHIYDWRHVAEWRGYYSGTIYKDVRQSLTNPYARTASDKYLIYLSDSVINEPVEFESAKALSDAKVILVGASAMKSQTAYEAFIENNGQSIERIIEEIVEYIASRSPPTASQLVLTNETFHLLATDADPENDPIVKRETMYVQNENYYDNPMGHVGYALSEGDSPIWSEEYLRTSLPFTGEYTIHRRIKDLPSSEPQLANYSYYSNESKTVILVNRKPVAQAKLDWTYDDGCACYQTSWIDQSFDLDHSVSDPVAKGIVDRKIRYQAVGGEWYYRIPDFLLPGSYSLEYIVKDMEGNWSDPFKLSFVLEAAPPPQLGAGLKSEDAAFTPAGGVPASESLRAYELWTRYPYQVNLLFQMTPAGNFINKTVPYYTGSKTGSDIDWNDVVTTVPATTPDGSYIYRITAKGSNGKTTFREFAVKVSTPIQLVPFIKAEDGSGLSDTIVVGYPAKLEADTTEYASQVTVVAFKGTSYQKSLTLSGNVLSTAGTGAKKWESVFTPTGAIPDGSYTFEWTARTPNGNVETKSILMKVISNTPPFGDFQMFTYNSSNSSMPTFEGDTLHIRSIGIGDNERDSLTVRYEAFDPSGTRRLNDIRAMTYPYSSAGPDFILPGDGSAVGTWTVKQTISDGKAVPVVRMKTLTVYALGIQGYVKHTEEWEANRIRHNAKHPANQRPAEWFWAGEAFVLEAVATDTGVSGTTPISVTAKASQELAGILTAFPPSQKKVWQGLLRSDPSGFKLIDLEDGRYSFVFTVTYSNGITRKSTVTINVKDTIDQYVQVHRIQ
ncbi:Athe_2463 domain-containing protein [Cohnella faecalis]|uniref:Athe_2463 domain-containing protein n=1 Tax=Cohnella faecalis TaxID=2315694 RepID=UPI00398A29DE